MRTPPLLAAVVVLAVTACGRAGPTLDAAGLGLPAADATPLATQQVATSPDGGIYRNPDRLDVVYVGPVDTTPVTGRLGDRAQDWSKLERWGALTAVAIRIRNDGKAGSEPELDDLQVASDLAPPGADQGELRHYFHPAYPLAALADRPLAGNCTVHLDPGQTATVVLVYPPLRTDVPVVWGRYRDFALTLSRRGGVGGMAATLSVGACTPPQLAPAP